MWDGVVASRGLVKICNCFVPDRVHSYRMDTCPFCATSIPDQSITCPSCGAALGGLQLRVGTVLHNGALTLERVLGQGGFGITYLAHDEQLNRSVSVKELFPEGSTRRGNNVVPPATYGARGFQDARTRFLEEARTLAQFHHEGVIRVYGVFEENATAYMTMEYLEGHTLGQEINQLGPLEPKTVREIAERILDALEVVHRAGLLHRDIKPDNVFLADDGRVVLIDFGSARTFVSSQTVQHTRLVSAGYAAPEQYASSAKFGPYTDIYGLSATLYHALMGQAPPSATDRFIGSSVPALPLSVGEGLRNAIERGLKLNVTERPPDVTGMISLMQESTPQKALQQISKSNQNLPKQNKRTSVVDITPEIAIRGSMLEVANKRHSIDKIECFFIEDRSEPFDPKNHVAVFGSLISFLIILSFFPHELASVGSFGIIILFAFIFAGWVYISSKFRPKGNYELIMQKSGRRYVIFESENRLELENIIQRLTPYL